MLFVLHRPWLERAGTNIGGFLKICLFNLFNSFDDSLGGEAKRDEPEIMTTEKKNLPLGRPYTLPYIRCATLILLDRLVSTV